jgi:hypothetical protein
MMDPVRERSEIMKLFARCLAGMVVVILIGGGTALAQEAPSKNTDDPDLQWLADPDPGAAASPGATAETKPEPPGPTPSQTPGLGLESDAVQRELDHSHAGSIDKIKHDDPARFARIKKIKDLADEYRKTDDPARKRAIEKELRPLVDQELKVQQDENKKRIDRLEKKLARMKDTLKKREENWEKVVDYTVKDITGQNDHPKPRPSADNKPSGK